MEDLTEHIRYILLFYFKTGNRAAKAHREISAIYVTNIMADKFSKIGLRNSALEIFQWKLYDLHIPLMTTN